MAEPRMRASSYLGALKLMKQMPQAVTSKILQKINPAELALIENASSMGWLAAKEFLPLQRAIYNSLDRDALNAFWKRNTLTNLEHPLLKGPLLFMAKITGMDQRSIAKSFSNSWSLISKDVGTMTVRDTESPTRVELHWTGIPNELVHEPSFVNAFAPAFAATFEVLKKPATSTFKLNAGANSGVFTFEWYK